MGRKERVLVGEAPFTGLGVIFPIAQIRNAGKPDDAPYSQVLAPELTGNGDSRGKWTTQFPEIRGRRNFKSPSSTYLNSMKSVRQGLAGAIKMENWTAGLELA